MTDGPIRSCAGCRTRRPQAELVRVASDSGGSVSVDPWEPETGRSGRRSPGRGAYVCPDTACVDTAVSSGALARALRLKGLPESLVERLRSRVS